MLTRIAREGVKKASAQAYDHFAEVMMKCPQELHSEDEESSELDHLLLLVV